MRRYESLQTYDTNILYISQNFINTNNIYSTNITKTRNLPPGFILNQFKRSNIFGKHGNTFISCEMALYDNWHAVK